MNLSNKTVLITGASSGIGYACAQHAAQLGAQLVLVARRKDRIDALAKECKQHYQTQSHTIQLDITNHNDVINAINDLPEQFMQIDILINNAGLAAGADPIQDTSTDAIDKMINTNIKGLLYITQAILPGMIARDQGHIINIGSIAGHEVYPNGTVYCATKHAVNALTRGIKMDVNHTHLRVSSIDPGMVETEFSTVRFSGDQHRAHAVYKGMTPLTPDDIADAVIYAATRPAHVNVSEIIILATDQAAATMVHRS